MVHQIVEASHADSSTALAKLVAADDFEPVARGAQRLRDVGWAFLDDFNRVCFGP